MYLLHAWCIWHVCLWLNNIVFVLGGWPFVLSLLATWWSYLLLCLLWSSVIMPTWSTFRSLLVWLVSPSAMLYKSPLHSIWWWGWPVTWRPTLWLSRGLRSTQRLLMRLVCTKIHDVSHCSLLLPKFWAHVGTVQIIRVTDLITSISITWWPLTVVFLFLQVWLIACLPAIVHSVIPNRRLLWWKTIALLLNGRKVVIWLSITTLLAIGRGWTWCWRTFSVTYPLGPR